MRLEINGESREALSAKSVAELVAELGLGPASVLIEHNGAALLRSEWNARPLADGDRIEILRVAAGG